MGKLVVSEFVSLDGVMEAPGGEPGYRHSGWTMDVELDPAVYEFKLREVQDAEALLLGRVTYDGFAAAWPGRDDEAGFAAKMNSMPKHVVSTTLADPTWENTTVIGSGVVPAVEELKGSTSGDVLVAGSATLVQSLYGTGLVDEYRLLVWPVVLGSGRRLFPDAATDKVKLALAHTRAFTNGVQLNVYTAG